jgi:hypothetical protein
MEQTKLSDSKRIEQSPTNKPDPKLKRIETTVTPKFPPGTKRIADTGK